jgi:polyhydroxybutyrate depolymerase|tara:strand:+ start:904 stop:1875 length:972 start_codon:yes stop_codon:yes gene_type:complete
MYRLLFLSIFLITSCGGGGSSSSDEVNVSIPNNNQNDDAETCTNFEERILKCEFTHKGLDRYYYIQLAHPEAEGSSSVLFNLHGYGSNALEQMYYTNFNNLANTKENNFILIHPQGAPLNTVLTSSSSHWNSGGWTIGSTVDDVDFIDTIIKLVSQKYNLNQDRIYSTGMSNGGFMSYHLACNLSSKIAAVASVTGSMSKETYEDCNPDHPTSILQVHGTIDATVPFEGNSALGMRSINDVMNYWKLYDACDTEPVSIITDYFDIEISVQHDTYLNCLNDVQVELYKIEGMGHVWAKKERYGISATEKIWEFFNLYDINGKIN